MNWCLPSDLLSHHGMFCHLMATPGAPLIAEEGGKETVAVLHKKVAYKSMFLMDTQKPIYLHIVLLVSCAVNDANSDIIFILNIKASWFSEDHLVSQQKSPYLPLQIISDHFLLGCSCCKTKERRAFFPPLCIVCDYLKNI